MIEISQLFLNQNMKAKKKPDFKKKSNDQYVFLLYRSIKQSLVRIFNFKNEKLMNETTLQMNKQNSDQLKMSQLKSFDQKRNIIRVKENALLESLREKLERLTSKKWKALNMKEKLDILFDLMAGFKIVQQRIAFLGHYEDKFREVSIKQKIVKELSLLRELIQKQTNKERQTRNNSVSKFKNSEMTYSSSLTATRPSSCNLTSQSRLFMQNYIKNKKKNVDSPNMKNVNKFYSHHFQTDEKDKFIINKLLKQSLNNRNTFQCNIKLKDKSISKQKQELIQKLNGQQNFVQSNESSEERISLLGLSKYSAFDQNKTKHKKTNSFDQRIETNKSVKSRHEGKMVKYDHEQKQKVGMKPFQSAYLIRQQTHRREKEKIKTGKYIRTEAFQSGYTRKYSSKRKLKRGTKRNRRANQSRFSIQNNEAKNMPQTKKSLDIQPTQNEEEVVIVSSKKESKVRFVQNIQLDQKDTFQEKEKEQQIKKSSSQIKIADKEHKMLTNSLHKYSNIKRKTVMYRKQQCQRDKTLTNSENIKKNSFLINIFDDLHELQTQMRKQNDKYGKDMVPIFYQDQEIVQKIEEKRLFRLFKRTPISSEQLVKSFKIFCSESSYKILNIKQYQRLYSFMSDNQWINHNFFNKKQLKILQKNLDQRQNQIN